MAEGYCVVEEVLGPADVVAARASLQDVLAATPRGRNSFEGFETQRGLRAVRQDAGLRRRRRPPPRARRARQGPRRVPAFGAHGHPDRAGRAGPGAAPGPVRVSAAARLPVGGDQHDVGARRLHRGQRGHPARPSEPPVGRAHPGPRGRRGGGHDARWLGELLPRPALARRRRQPHRPASAGRDPGVRVLLAPAPGEPPLAVPRELAATLPVRLQELLGYNIYPPFLGYVDGRHPRRYLPEPQPPSERP